MASKRHPHTEAVVQARDSMHKVIDSIESGFMLDKASAATEKRREMLAGAAPDVQRYLAEDVLPMYMAERLARMDMD